MLDTVGQIVEREVSFAGTGDQNDMRLTITLPDFRQRQLRGFESGTNQLAAFEHRVVFAIAVGPWNTPVFLNAIGLHVSRRFDRPIDLRIDAFKLRPSFRIQLNRRMDLLSAAMTTATFAIVIMASGCLGHTACLEPSARKNR